MKHNDLVAYLKGTTALADDQTAARAVELYKSWAAGLSVAAGDRLQYDGQLYKVITDHTTQADWTPDTAASLFTVIDVDHAGTADDPIPWAVNMECSAGKVYSWNGGTYLCIRDSGIALAYTPDQLIGQYFEEA